MVSSKKDFYPPEVLERKPADVTLDLYMATKVMVFLVGGDVGTDQMPDTVPKEMQDLLRKALNTFPRHRPQSVFDHYTELDQVLERVVGPKKFRPFTMPLGS